MDYIKRDTNLFDSFHFLNTPYIRDGEFGKFYPGETNALYALQSIGKSLFFNQSNSWGKAFSTLSLIHIVGDLHQPLHAASLLSREYKFHPPGGDLGGNLYKITYTSKKQDMAYKQLHLLYDCIADEICNYMPEVVTKEYENEIKDYVDGLMKEFPLSKYESEFLYPSYMFDNITAFSGVVNDWALESYTLAIDFYQMVPKMNVELSEEFIEKLSVVLRERVALAGYRIGHLLAHANKQRLGPNFNNLTTDRGLIIFLILAFFVAMTIALAYRKKYKTYALVVDESHNGLLNQ